MLFITMLTDLDLVRQCDVDTSLASFILAMNKLGSSNSTWKARAAESIISRILTEILAKSQAS